MTADALLKSLRAQPFQPFVIHLADGRRIPVRHSEFVARSPTGRTCVVYGQGDEFEIVDLFLVSSLKVGNGARRPRRK